MADTTARTIIQHAKEQQRLVLTESEAKALVRSAGIPSVPTELARTAEEAITLAQGMDFPVALKISSADIAHKSDSGGVQLNLATEAAVRHAFDAIMTAGRTTQPDAVIEGVSVQPMARPGVEVIIGLTSDPQFGPLVMFGLGGVHVEVLKDVAFGGAPLRPPDAARMLREISGFPLLSGHRGRVAVDLAALEQALLSLSALAEAQPDIQELDLNPVFAYKDGCLAVDAHVVLHAEGPRALPRPLSDATRAALARTFHPRTVAVVGDKRAMNYLWLRSQSTFEGRVYSVQIDEREIQGITDLGVPNYPSLESIPEEVDYVIIAVPRQVAPHIVAACVAKKVAGVMLFTSGFSEVHDEEGQRLEQIVTQTAQEAGLALIGPNCMGIYHPKIGLRNYPDLPAGESGSIGFIGQSGTHTITFSMAAASHGLRMSKAVSFGNAAVLDASDYLDYLAHDAETEIIGLYLEGVREGRRFFTLLREVTPHKPVIIWKGGQTEAGQRATASHTGSLAVPAAVWASLVRQAGAVSVSSFDELLDVIKLLRLTKPATGDGVGLIAMTGGPSVSLTDAFAAAGLRVPPLSDASYEELSSFFNVIGGSFRNPLDSGHTIGMGQMTDTLDHLLSILDRDPHIDAIVMDTGAGLVAGQWAARPQTLTTLLDTLSRFAARSAKPFFVVLQPFAHEASLLHARAQFQQRGIATVATHERAAAALRLVTDYHRAHSACV